MGQVRNRVIETSLRRKAADLHLCLAQILAVRLSSSDTVEDAIVEVHAQAAVVRLVLEQLRGTVGSQLDEAVVVTLMNQLREADQHG